MRTPHACRPATRPRSISLDNPTQPAVIKAAAAAGLRRLDRVAEKSRWHSEEVTKNGFKLAR
jgi:hypothetical protein